MVRIWAKTIVENNKLKDDLIYEAVGSFDPNELYLHVQEICHRMDIPSPVVLKTHAKNFMEFNTCTFLPRDFVESINFDKFVLENAVEN